jgi:murein DD-endopeptidase MepM/ murein hydrolase activator NlpD
MNKVKFYYNTNTLKFEKHELPLRVKLLRAFGFVAASLVTGFIMMFVFLRLTENPDTKLYRKQYEDLRDNYKVVEDRTRQLEQQMIELESRDNNVYRSIFDAFPVHDSARVKDMALKKEVSLISTLSESELMQNLTNQLNNLSLRIVYQDKSYKTIENLVKNKEKLLLAIPAIQPVVNKDLTKQLSGFGMRLHPILKIYRPHNGVDFTAPTGVPIYATADGVVSKAENGGGYGNHIVINHGYGYETFYAHMSKMKARVGEKIKRGEVIGYVGSTGLSSGPHCHYEVHRNGQPVDPIYYFYNDITPAQFDRIRKLANAANQSLD